MKKKILVTGATAGFGKAIAERFVKEGNDVVITGRRKERLEQLAATWSKAYTVEVLPLHFDVRVLPDVEKALGTLPEAWHTLDVLVNNAGLAAGLGPIQEGLVDDWEQMIDTNVKGLLYMTRIIAPWMVERGKGHIINIGSIAGKEAYPNGNVYCGTKFAVDAITKRTRIDLVHHGIKVTHIAPGAADTEFSLVRFHGDKERADSVYDGFTPLYAEDIAEVVWYVTTLPDSVNINDLVITPTAQANATTIVRR